MTFIFSPYLSMLGLHGLGLSFQSTPPLASVIIRDEVSIQFHYRMYFFFFLSPQYPSRYCDYFFLLRNGLDIQPSLGTIFFIWFIDTRWKLSIVILPFSKLLVSKKKLRILLSFIHSSFFFLPFFFLIFSPSNKWLNSTSIKPSSRSGVVARSIFHLPQIRKSLWSARCH